MNQSREDYLKEIYCLSEKNLDIGARSIEISKALKISKPSVSFMIKKLANENIVEATPYSNIILSKKGLKLAKKIVRKHRVLEVFLSSKLKYTVKKAHIEAHEIEHGFSDDAIERLFKFLNKPKNSPDGKTIPILE